MNNAGVNIPQDSLDVTVDNWDKIMDINLKASFFMAQAVGRVMISQGRGVGSSTSRLRLDQSP